MAGSINQIIFSRQYLITVAAVLTFTRHSHGEIPRVAIVGAGIGGASATHYLKSLFEETDVEIQVYEAKRIGGRLATTFINNHEYEVGGSVIHQRNKYMTDFTKLTGLEKRLSKTDDGKMGLYDGKEYVYTESSWHFISLLKMLWRYGISMFKWEKLMDDTLTRFSKIYDWQENGYAFTTVDKLLAAMSPHFANLTQTTLRQHLQKLHFSSHFIDELAMAITRVNYGQTPDINGFVGEVAMAGATPGLWSVAGGNRLVAERLLQNASIEIIPETVTEIIYQTSGKSFVVVSTAADLDSNNNEASSYPKRQEEYDMIIIASPLINHVSRVNFTGFPTPIKNFKGRYQRTVATVVDGEINKTYLNMHDYNIDSILTTTELEFNSLSRIYPVDAVEGEEYLANVWKVFSKQPLTEQDLDNLFESRRDTQVFDWLAYPHYSPPEELHPFVLHPNLPIFYTSAIEWAASAMEMSCIAGRNAALLAHQFWLKDKDKVDPKPGIDKHSEL